MQTQTLFWAGNAKLDFHIISCFETPSVMTCRQGYICIQTDWIITMDVDASVVTDEVILDIGFNCDASPILCFEI